MSVDHSLSFKWQRYEAKYLIDERSADRIRDYCQSFLPPDPNSARMPDQQYHIHSIYLDSSDEQLLRSAMNRQVNRLKLRVRTYRHFLSSADAMPAFYEIKRKSHGLVQKTRAKVPPDVADTVMWRESSWNGPLSDAVAAAYLEEFCVLRRRIRARPVIAVYYTREAYENGADDHVRISFDRKLHFGLLARAGSGHHDAWWPVPLRGVIFEIKFTNTYPFWVRDLVRRENLMRRGVCKYVMCRQAAHGSSLVG